MTDGCPGCTTTLSPASAACVASAAETAMAAANTMLRALMNLPLSLRAAGSPRLGQGAQSCKANAVGGCRPLDTMRPCRLVVSSVRGYGERTREVRDGWDDA